MIALLLLFIATIANGVVAYFQWKESTNHKKHKSSFISACIFCLITLITGLYQLHSENLAKTANNLAEKDLRVANNKVISLQGSLIDSTKKIIGLQDRVINLQDYSTKKVVNLQDKVINLQNESTKQITGGDPQLYLQIVTGYEAKNISSFERFISTPRRLEQYVIDFNLYNFGKYYLKNVHITIMDNYKKIKQIVSSDGNGQYSYSPSGDYKEPDMESSFYNVDYSIVNYETRELYTMAPQSQKAAYKTRAPLGIGVYDYQVTVEWSNGFFIQNIQFVEVDSVLRVKKNEIVINDKKINDPIHYFKLQIPKALKQLTVCGTINYQKEKFIVYWYKTNNYIFVSHLPYDLFGLNNYHKWKSDNQAHCLVEAKNMLSYAFKK